MYSALEHDQDQDSKSSSDEGDLLGQKFLRSKQCEDQEHQREYKMKINMPKFFR